MGNENRPKNNDEELERIKDTKISGRLISFGVPDKYFSGAVFSPDCEIDIPETVPVYDNFDRLEHENPLFYLTREDFERQADALSATFAVPQIYSPDTDRKELRKIAAVRGLIERGDYHFEPDMVTFDGEHFTLLGLSVVPDPPAQSEDRNSDEEED
jgi:hypothetical protein